jgi:Mrp family chromosome partitioning ATPase
LGLSKGVKALAFGDRIPSEGRKEADPLSKTVFNAETEKDDILSTSPDEFLKGLERSDAFLPFPAETSPVPPESHIVVHAEPRSAGADRFRLVQVRLRHLQAQKKIKSLLITSPLPADGKSTVALNLATALSEQGKRSVLLLEADVYRPSLLRKLGLNPWPGLTECLDMHGDPMLAIRRIDPLGFYLLPAGTPTEAGNLLQSALPANFVEGLTGTFRWILIDAPPATPMAEILALQVLCDATLLVARAGVTPREAIGDAAKTLGMDHILGVLLNGVEGIEKSYSKYYGYIKPQNKKG